MDISETDTLGDGLEEIGRESRELMEKIPSGMKTGVVTVQRKMFKEMVGTIVFAVLLKKDEIYGYEIIHLAQRFGNFGRKISASSVYPVLHAMEKEELIKSKWVMKKRVYRITPKGRKAAEMCKAMQKSVIIIKAKFLKLMFDEEVKL